ncbi:hypothetical protein VIGAN_UM012400 [Vigna angularis var. angularis]|uniref:Protein Iojap-related, mitochondrial n=2 Tax=Phaseolus angularis TaxID=3914 RepID=A0A0S3TDH0_PHAAN|nr:hypothetical protein VIGAN_UM012400 [Vigna angularis var. angularis]
MDIKADDVKVIPVPKHCDWADFMVLATGRSTWHVNNIAQALIYKAKQKQRRMMLPSVKGEEGGKWIVIDSGISCFCNHFCVHFVEFRKSIRGRLDNLLVFFG